MFHPSSIMMTTNKLLRPLYLHPQPINPHVWEDFLPIPDGGSSGNASNPVMYKQIGGNKASGSSEGTTAVYALTEGAYFCMLAESGGEAVLFDAPEGELSVERPLVYGSFEKQAFCQLYFGGSRGASGGKAWTSSML